MKTLLRCLVFPVRFVLMGVAYSIVPFGLILWAAEPSTLTNDAEIMYGFYFSLTIGLGLGFAWTFILLLAYGEKAWESFALFWKDNDKWHRQRLFKELATALEDRAPR